MFIKEIVDYSGNETKHINRVCGKNIAFSKIQGAVIHCALKDYMRRF
jgi:hypothetical protein